ncbi:trypsin-like peptidase domain-containing protein [Streptomyces sp. NPDC050428]|uniref:caspase, EACC1-associated type n=1 Tax=Streptomyces sp. NPDC050428 TaxID=3155757 RepID=UPI0034378FA2
MLEWRALSALAEMATVVVTGPDRGFLGTGFYVAPRTVLTAAHVVRGQVGGLTVHSATRGETEPCKARVRSVLHTEEQPGGMIPVEQDLALLELVDDPGDHECVWLTDLAAWHGGRLTAYAHMHEPGTRQPVMWSAALDVNARTGPYGLHLAPAVEIPQGSSGGPLVDSRGDVVGMLKARRQGGGGLGVLLSALRGFGPEYQRMITEHDRWHGTRPLEVRTTTWTREQQLMFPDSDGRFRADGWTPQDRRTAFHLLASFPHPDTPATVVELVRKAMDGQPVFPGPIGIYPELQAWRDGHGLLGERTVPRPAALHLRYLWLVAQHLRTLGGAEALLDWVDQRAQSLDDLGLLRRLQGRTARPRPARPAGGAPAPQPCWTSGAALLVGVSSYTHLPDVPSIRNNLDDLSALLTAPEFGIPEERVKVIADPVNDKDIHDVIDDLVEQADPSHGAFLLYYAGHGRSHPEHGRLLLSLAGSRQHRAHSYWAFDKIRDHISECGLPVRLVLLDSCYSGSALDMLSGLTDSSVAIGGTYVMTSSGPTEPSAVTAGRNTAFTAGLLAALRDGVPAAGPVLDTETVYEAIRTYCESRNLPHPSRQIRHDGARIPLMPNRAHHPQESR